MENPDDQNISMNLDVLERMARVLAYTKFHREGQDDEAQRMLADELEAAGGNVLPFARMMVWLVETVADLRPDDLGQWLEATLGAAMADLAMRQHPPK